MTTEDIRELIVSVDPAAQRYESTNTGGNYTVWREFERLATLADNVHPEAWSFQVDRFTHEEDDPIASALWNALDNDPRVSVRHIVDYEQETRYIHHIFDCEGF